MLWSGGAGGRTLPLQGMRGVIEGMALPRVRSLHGMAGVLAIGP